LENTSNKQEIK